MAEIIEFILFTVANWGYLGIFCLMTIESSFIPFPSEVVMIPAGYLAFKGEMSLWMILFSGTAGSLFGALINYYLAFFLGRRFLRKFGKYFLLKEDNLDIVEKFFKKHGAFSTFSGRLIPMIRQLISIPAGLAKMNLPKFMFYTSLGSGIWATILTLLGYFIGQNEELIKEYLRLIVVSLLVLIAIAAAIYVKINKNNEKTNNL